jgi:putative membrane protein
METRQRAQDSDDGRFSMTKISVICAAGLAVATAGLAQNLNSQDKQFLNEAANGNMHEVQMGHLGLQKAASDGTKKFSQRLVDDHTAAGNEVRELAQKKGVTIADDHKDVAKNAFASKTGSEFDKAFAKDMVEDHRKDIEAFDKENKNGSDPDVKKWAEKTLPTLKSHLQQAESLAK